MLNRIVSTEMISALNPTLGIAFSSSLFEPMPNPREKIKMTITAKEALSSFMRFLFRSK
jgi:hypothetical protein